jgi:hypothetical protein
LRVKFLLTCYSCLFSIGCHSSCHIRFVGWLNFNLNNHSCNRSGNSQKNTSCKPLNTYLSRYLCSVYLRFLLSFYKKLSSFFLNHLSISTIAGFYGLNIPFYFFILLVVLQHIPSNLSCVVPTINETIWWMFGLTWVLILIDSNKTLKPLSLLVT